MNTLDMLRAVADFARSGVPWTSEERSAVHHATDCLLFNNNDGKYEEAIGYGAIAFSRTPVEMAAELLRQLTDEEWLCKSAPQWRATSRILREIADYIDACEDECDATDGEAP